MPLTGPEAVSLGDVFADQSCRGVGHRFSYLPGQTSTVPRCSEDPRIVVRRRYWPYEREREIKRHRPYLYSRQDLIAPLRAVADPKRVFPTCPGTGRFAVFLSPELDCIGGFARKCQCRMDKRKKTAF